MPIYHLTTSAAWAEAKERGAYTAPSLGGEGFIHCSTADQLLPVANAFYLEVESPVVLEIDPGRLTADLFWEAPDEADPFADEKFPHIYGPIDLEAVLAVIALKRGDDGLYHDFDSD